MTSRSSFAYHPFHLHTHAQACFSSSFSIFFTVFHCMRACVCVCVSFILTFSIVFNFHLPSTKNHHRSNFFSSSSGARSFSCAFFPPNLSFTFLLSIVCCHFDLCVHTHTHTSTVPYIRPTHAQDFAMLIPTHTQTTRLRPISYIQTKADLKCDHFCPSNVSRLLAVHNFLSLFMCPCVCVHVCMCVCVCVSVCHPLWTTFLSAMVPTLT